MIHNFTAGDLVFEWQGCWGMLGAGFNKDLAAFVM